MEAITFDTLEACKNYINSVPRTFTFYLHHYSSDGVYIGAVEVSTKEVLRICKDSIYSSCAVTFKHYQDVACFITIKSK